MSVYRYVRLDVFSNQPFTGIQLAVFPDAAGIDERRMQRIANEMALPETTFVFPPEAPETDARVRIFTPTRELPMAGSPTIGTVFALAGAGRLRASADKTVLGLGIGRDDSLTEAEFDELVTEYNLVSWTAHPALLRRAVAKHAMA